MEDNLDPTRMDVLRVVDEINNVFTDIEFNLYKGDIEHVTPCLYTEHMGVFYIKLLGSYVWDSDNDGRVYLDDSDDVKEDLLQHVLGQLLKVTTVLQGVVAYCKED